MAECPTQQAAGEGMADLADPNTVLTSIGERISKLVVSNGTASSEPTTPSESPQSLGSGLRDWLTDALNMANTNGRMYAKLLVSNAAAGSIIGKGGANINDVQARTFARIQLSKSQEYFPGTQDRTLLVTGRLKQVIAALSLILAKLVREGVAPLTPRSRAAAMLRQEQGEAEEDSAAEPPQGPHRLLVKLLVPQPLCGIIIGKSGATIRQYAADTDTSIRVTSPEGFATAASHRIVTIGGEADNVLKAIALMVLKQSEDPKFGHYSELPAESSMTQMGPYASHASSWLQPQGTTGATYYTQASMLLNEEQSLLLFGPDGSAALDVQQVTGVRIHIEPAGELPNGQRLQRLALAGSVEAVQYAQWLLGQRLMAAMHTAAMAAGPMAAAPPGPIYMVPAYAHSAPAAAARGPVALGRYYMQASHGMHYGEPGLHDTER